jgi:hypothetical protein
MPVIAVITLRRDESIGIIRQLFACATIRLPRQQ